MKPELTNYEFDARLIKAISIVLAIFATPAIIVFAIIWIGVNIYRFWFANEVKVPFNLFANEFIKTLIK